jgi:hypothetical protein
MLAKKLKQLIIECFFASLYLSWRPAFLTSPLRILMFDFFKNFTVLKSGKKFVD